MQSTYSLNDCLKSTLLSYVEANQEDNKEFFKARRELSIARYALEQQAEVYHKLITLLKSFTEQLEQATENTEELLLKTYSIIEKIEDKSSKLINSVNSITRALKTGQEIEDSLSSKIDGAQVYSIISQLPYILENILLKLSNDPVLTQNVLLQFKERLDNDLLLITDHEQKGQQAVPLEIIEKQVLDMFSSIPTGPRVEDTVVPEHIEFREKHQ